MQKFVILLAIVQLFNTCPTDERCASCLGDRCQLCWDGYLNAEGRCVEPEEEIEKCKRYSSETACSLCHDGYYLTQQNKCEEIVLDDCLRVNQLN